MFVSDLFRVTILHACVADRGARETFAVRRAVVEKPLVLEVFSILLLTCSWTGVSGPCTTVDVTLWYGIPPPVPHRISGVDWFAAFYS